MKRRLLSLALVLAMVLSLVPVGMVAAESEHVHCMCGQVTTKDATCEDCGTKAVVWTGITAMPSAPGNYYLTKDVSAAPTFLTSGEYSFCLCSHNLTSAAGKRIIDVANAGTKLNITDCRENAGSVTGATGASQTGSALCVNSGAELNLYNGRITENTAATNGVILVSNGTFNMYGGEITNNTSGRGAVYLDSTNSVARFLGGKVTGNHAKNTGAVGGGGGVYGLKGTIELGGTAQIYDNTAAETTRNGDMYIRNDQGMKVQLSATKPLENGAKLRYGLWTAEADTTDMKAITGAPTVWSSTWLRYNGTKVGYADGKFFLEEEHTHCLCGKETTLDATCAECGSKAVIWSATGTVPTTDGYYYLSETVKTAKVAVSANVALCLHGKNLESAAGDTIVKTMPGYTFQLTDCNQSVGSVTGATATTAIEVQTNSTFVLWNGKITGNTGTGNGTVWVNTGTTSLPGGTFIMYGGEISGNTTGRGAVFATIPSSTKKDALLRLLGGTITGNTGTNTGGMGAGAGVYSFCPVELGGDIKIYGNIAADGPADLYLRNDSGYTGKVIVSAEKPLTDGAQVSYDLSAAEGDLTDLKLITGTPSVWNRAWVSYAGEAVRYEDGKFFTKETPKHVHCLCGKELTLGSTCASCGTEAVGWTGIDKMPATSEPGYYYLTADVSVAPFFVTSGEFAFCLNGCTMTSAAGKRMINVEGDGTTLSITDCQDACGTITGATGASEYGSTLRVNANGFLNLYNGKITGNSCPNDGVIYVGSGGTFTMHGGEVSGNTSGRGVIYGVAASGGKNSNIRILGGTVTGNTGTNTGNMAGGAGVYSFSPVEIGGNAVITGNTAKNDAPDLLLRNDYGASLIVSQEVPLADGANVSYSLHTVETDPMNLKDITGTPAQWNMEWVKYDGVKVGYEAGRFYTKYALDYADHDHDGQKWVSVTQDNKQLPNGDGYYVLETDVKLSQLLIIAKEDHVHLCLNGHTLTAAEGNAHFDVYGKLTICDCTAKTVSGTYTAGKLVGGTGKTGGSVRLRPTAEMYLIDGIFTENACAEGGNGGVVYADAGAYIKMTGGQMCGNTGAMGGAVRLGAPNVSGPFCTFILEGGSICHNESINMGGGIYAAGGADIRLIGGSVANNEAAQGGGGICVNSQAIDGTALVTLPTTITLTGTTIADNAATTWGGNVYIKTGTVLNMQGGIITGGKSKVGAGVLLESQGTTLNLSGGKINGNFGGAAGAAAVYASNNTIVNMTGGEVCNNVSEAGGGGIVLYAAKGTFTGGTISNNVAKGGGGGMCIQGSEVYLGKITISGNQATGTSGGIYVSRAGEVYSNVTIDGAQIINNTCTSSGGGIFLYMNGNKITMLDGLIAGNQARDGGGVCAQREVTFTMEGGTIKNNKSTANGGGFYASIDSTFLMNGGTISGNYAEGNGGGMYCLRSNVTLNGGTITGNAAKGSGGGVVFSGTKGKLAGVTVSYNSSEGSGAGVMILRNTSTVDGVKTTFDSYVTMTGGTVTGNTTPKAGAGVLANGEGCHFTLYGGTISYNKADKFGVGIYMGKNSTLDMYGGVVCYNESTKDACGGVQIDGAIANITGGKIHHNKAARSAGGMLVGREAVVRISNLEIYENEAKLGGGMVLQGKADLIADGMKIYGNSSTTDAGGVYLGTYTHPTFKNTQFYDNTCTGNGGAFWSWATSTVKMEGCKFYDNTAGAEGGGIWTRGDAVYLTDCVIEGNQATGNGGGVGSGMMGSATPRATPGIVMENCSVEKNISGGMGGGMYISSGAKCDMKDVTFVGNIAAEEGGAFWAKDELTVHDLKVTNNESGGAGYAVYLDDSDYDGHSYVAGLMKFTGNVKIHDNRGGDLYLGEKTSIVIGEDGLGQDTLIHLVMHSGLLTDWVFGAYDYEGGDLQYTVTYGDRSLTDPEQKEPPADENRKEDQTEAGSTDVLLYVGIGAVVVVLLAAILLVLKKRKSAAAEKK